jgi:hypothetical protein
MQEKPLIPVTVASLCFSNAVDPKVFSQKLVEIKKTYSIERLLCPLPETTDCAELVILVKHVKDIFGSKAIFYGKVVPCKGPRPEPPIADMAKELSHKSCKVFLISDNKFPHPKSEESIYLKVKDAKTKLVYLKAA